MLRANPLGAAGFTTSCSWPDPHLIHYPPHHPCGGGY